MGRRLTPTIPDKLSRRNHDVAATMPAIHQDRLELLPEETSHLRDVISRTLSSSHHPLHPIEHSLYILTCFAEVLEWSCKSGMSVSFSYCIDWNKLSRAPCSVKETGLRSLLMPRHSFRYLQSRYQQGPADAVEVEGVTASKSAL